jgi:hypothetical protein
VTQEQLTICEAYASTPQSMAQGALHIVNANPPKTFGTWDPDLGLVTRGGSTPCGLPAGVIHFRDRLSSIRKRLPFQAIAVGEQYLAKLAGLLVVRCS